MINNTQASSRKPFLWTVIFLISILTWVQCKKDNPSGSTPSFVIGKFNPYFLTKQLFDPPIEIDKNHPGYDIEEIDVNSDGIKDFKLMSSEQLSPSGLFKRYASITPLHANIEISFVEIPDTSFKCITGNNYNGDSVVSITYYNSDTLFQCIVDDTIFNICQEKYPVKYEFGYRLNDDMDWTNDEIEFANLNYSFYDNFENNIIYWIYYKLKRSNWNGLSAGYLLFRLKVNGHYKYGWVLLEIYDYKGMRIFEIVCEN